MLKDCNILIVGLGQIGASLATDLVERDLVGRVIGFDIDQSVRDRAKKKKIVHETVESLEAGVTQADIIILAAPIRRCIALVPEIGRLLPDNWDGIILDVASTKVPILQAVTEANLLASYVGGHPLTGTEKQGLGAAGAGLFVGKTFVLTPTPETDESKTGTVRTLVEMIGAQVLIMTAKEHDRLIALTSHLPYTLALALMHLVANESERDDRVWSMTAGSFAGVTRVAGSPEDLTVDMLQTNAENVGEAIDKMITELTALKRLMEKGDETELAAMVKQIRQLIQR